VCPETHLDELAAHFCKPTSTGVEGQPLDLSLIITVHVDSHIPDILAVGQQADVLHLQSSSGRRVFTW
jgi:hypothetical protein